MAKYLITGANGQLGRAFQKILPKNSVIFTDQEELDITDRQAVLDFVEKNKPEVILNCAAYTNVDGCEENQELANSVNHLAVAHLAEACNKIDATLVHVSTDYVFDGTKKEPYTEEDKTNPQSVYGKTKLLGEEAAKKAEKYYIFRTSWVYGDGKNFVRTMLSLAENLSEINVVSDQVGRPTFAEDLAQGILEALDKKIQFGIYNYQNSGAPASWASFARKIFEIAGKTTKVIDITFQEYLKINSSKKVAPRPANSVLELAKIEKNGIIVPKWQDSLDKYLASS